MLGMGHLVGGESIRLPPERPMPSQSTSIAEDVAPGVVVYGAFHHCFILDTGSQVLLKANSEVPDEMTQDKN